MATLIFKGTENCNSNCIYCDVVEKRKSKEIMNFDVLELVFIRINEYLLTYPEEKFTYIWHGGEPLMLGVDFFKKALSFQEQHCRETKSRIEHCLQSNITLLNQDFINVFKVLGINSVGTSYDPELGIRGFGKERDTLAYNRLFLKSVRLLEENNFGWGLIYVVTKRSLENPLKIFHFLCNIKLSAGFNMNPVLIYGDDINEIGITPDEYIKFLGVIFSEWWQHRDRYPDVEPFKSLVSNIIDGNKSLGCVDSGECAYHYVYIGPDGETSQCGRAADWKINLYGNIKDFTLKEIFNHDSRIDLFNRNDILLQNDCKECRFWDLCHGGCPLDSYSVNKSFNFKSEWCDAKRKFIENYFEPITNHKFNGFIS